MGAGAQRHARPARAGPRSAGRHGRRGGLRAVACGGLPPAAEFPEASGTDAPFEPSERMRFVRWLVQQGRLSEWKVE